MFSWLRRRAGGNASVHRRIRIGEVQVRSGALLLGDPQYLYNPQRIEGLSPASFPVFAEVVEYPEGGRRIARLGIRFRSGAGDSRGVLGEIGVDSAMVVLIDERDYQNHWKEVGAERIGVTSTPREHEHVAELIGRRFNLIWRRIDSFHSVFEEPISKALETEILEYLKSFKEYEAFPFLYFHVRTSNTMDLIFEAMRGRDWNELELHQKTGAKLLAVTTGFGDGTYPVEALYASGELIGFEIEFIGPAQEPLLAAFPLLRT